jgi:polygalacturonase
MEVSILEFGATSPQNGCLSTSAIQEAIDYCHQHGGGIVKIPRGIYTIGTLFLKAKVILNLEEGSRLVGSHHLEDYPLPEANFTDAVDHVRGRALLIADGAHQSGLRGLGTIDGMGMKFLMDSPRHQERPFLVRFVRCHGVHIEGITLENSAAWTLHLLDCEDLFIKNINIDSRCNENNDGIDIDSCRRVKIEHCKITSNDDAICLKSTVASSCEDIEVHHCDLWSQCGTIKLGTESYGDMRRVHIHDCHVRHAGLGIIKIISMDGAIVEDVLIENIEADGGTGPIFIRLGDRRRVYAKGDAPKPSGAMRQVTLRNITVKVVIPSDPIYHHWHKTMVSPLSCSGVLITGLPGHQIKDIIIEDCSFQMHGGGKTSHRDLFPDEQPEMYPEIHHFGILPASCCYIRHAQNVSLNNVQFVLQNNDERDEVVCFDSKNISFENCVLPNFATVTHS